MSRKQCRICREFERDEGVQEISPYYAQILLDFDIRVGFLFLIKIAEFKF